MYMTLWPVKHAFILLLSKLITLVVIATWAKLFNFLSFYSYLPLLYPPPPLNRVRAAAKISAGGVCSPNNQLYLCELPSPSTNYSSKGI